MELLNKIISEYTIAAFGLTVMHSLWIGAIISGLTAILFAFIRKSTHARYIIATTGLVIIFISSLIIFVNIKDSTHQWLRDDVMIPGVSKFQSINENYHQGKLSGGFNISGSILGITRDAERLFINHSELIVLIWIIGVLILGAKFTGAYIYANRFRKRCTIDIPDIWTVRIEKIAEKINLKTKIRAVKSAFVRIPFVTGWLKPVVILPASVLSGIPVEQVEAIIAHELAHIKRNDYLVNIFQSFIEIIMFFNPSVWWISDIIRKERENCCDDIALAAGTKSLVYVKALASMQEISLSPPAPAIAIKRNNNKLINRIKRITAMKNRKNLLKEKLIAILSIAFLVSALIALTGFDTTTDSFLQVVPEKNIAGSSFNNWISLTESPEPLFLPQDTLHQKTSTIITKWTDPADNKQKEVKMLIKDRQVIELTMDGKVIPPEDHYIYQDLIDDTIQDYEEAMKEIEDLDIEEIEKEVEKAMQEIEEIDMEEIAIDIEEAMKGIEEIDMEEIETEIEEAMKGIEEIDMEEIETEIEEAMKGIEEIDMEEIETEIEEAMKEIEEIDMEEIETEIEEAMKEIEEVDMAEIEREIEEAMLEMEEIDIETIMEDTNSTIEKLEDAELDKKEDKAEKSKEERKETLKKLENKKK